MSDSEVDDDDDTDDSDDEDIDEVDDEVEDIDDVDENDALLDTTATFRLASTRLLATCGGSIEMT